MGRLTWLVLVVACLLFVGLLVGVVAQIVATIAYVQVPTSIEEVSGIVLSRTGDAAAEESLPTGAQVFEGDKLHVTFGSTARMRMFDGSVISLFPETRLRVDRSRAPRLGGRDAEAVLGIESGAAQIAVAPALQVARNFELTTPAGVAQLSPGQYTVRVASDATRISVWDGKATMLVDRQVVDVTPGRKIILGSDGKLELVDVLENVMVNGTFADRFNGWTFWEEQQSQSDVRGQLQIGVPNEINAPGLALQLTRQSAGQTHNETGLRQFFQRDVSGAHSIQLDMLLKVESASLSGGGYLGSEYPLMVRIRYSTLRGGDQTWTHGFFFANPDRGPVPYSSQIQKGVWTHYQADLLLEVQPVPMVIKEIQILAAGHSYDASVSDVKLLVD